MERNQMSHGVSPSIILILRFAVRLKTSSTMNDPVGHYCSKAPLAIAIFVAWLPLCGCSPASPQRAVLNSNSNLERTAPLGSEQSGGRSEQVESQENPDVIIVGAGISGLSAALDLGRGGAKVTVLDMSSVFGGHAVMSQGSVSIVATPA